MRGEHWHLVRAAIWPTLGLYILFFDPSLGKSVALVIGLSLYANFAGDISAWQAGRADRHAREDS